MWARWGEYCLFIHSPCTCSTIPAHRTCLFWLSYIGPQHQSLNPYPNALHYITGARSLRTLFPESLVSRITVNIVSTRVTFMSLGMWKGGGRMAQKSVVLWLLTVSSDSTVNCWSPASGLQNIYGSGNGFLKYPSLGVSALTPDYHSSSPSNNF